MEAIRKKETVEEEDFNDLKDGGVYERESAPPRFFKQIIWNDAECNGESFDDIFSSFGKLLDGF